MHAARALTQPQTWQPLSGFVVRFVIIPAPADMSLAPGTRIGPYEIVSIVGAGGMGEVYRATDTKLKRQVAIKILPLSLAEDHDRLMRFQREAEVLASLNHPHIAGIYGLEETDGSQALIMELVEGEDLSAIITRGVMSLTAALPIAKQIAEALDAAHEQGIVHRDLKPANIKVRADGTVKVLDFGLAKVTEPAGGSSLGLSMSPTLSNHATQAGIILGTAAYMSPEQARGQAVDKRTDIWAFGCVLHEMLTGRATFARETLTDTLAAVVERDPDWSALPVETPASVRRLLKHCLEKDPKVRLRDIGDARAELEDSSPDALNVEQHRRPSWMGSRIRLALAGTVALAAAVIALYVLRSSPFSREVPSPRVARFSTAIEAPDWLGLDRPTLAISPDGSRLVYVNRNDAGRDDAGRRLDVRVIDQFEGRPIQGTEVGSNPFFAPDGTSIGFFAGGKLKTVALDGGTPADIADVEAVPLGATWSAGGSIVLGSMNGSALWRVPASGGRPVPLTPVGNDKVISVEAWPEALPDGSSVLFTIMPTEQKPAFVAVASLATGARKPLIEGSAARYVSTGHLVFMRGSSLMAVEFDPRALEVIGTPVELLDNVRQAQGAGAAQFGVSAAGGLVYISRGSTRPQSHLMLVDRGGQAEPIGPPPPRPYGNPRVSPDGQRIVVDISENGRSDLWVYRRASGYVEPADLQRSEWCPLVDA